MTVTAYAVVTGQGRIVKLHTFSFQAERQQRLLAATKPAPGPYRVVQLTGEVERVERRR